MQEQREKELSEEEKITMRALENFLVLAGKAAIQVRRSDVTELSWCLTAAHEAARERRLAMLNSYITYCALLIQRNWRGFYERNYWAPFIVRMGGIKRARRIFSGPINGWRVRSIMRLAEVQKRSETIRDHDRELRRALTESDRIDLEHSRKAMVLNFIHMIKTLQRDGQWTMLKLNHLTIDDHGYQVPRTKQEEQIALENIMREKKTLQQMAVLRAKHGYIPKGSIQQPSLKKEKNSPRSSTFVEVRSNKVDWNISSGAYKEKAAENFERRMQYKPGFGSPQPKGQ